MTQVNIADAKENLEELIKLLQTKQQDEIILTQDGKPTAKLEAGKDVRTLGIGEAELKLPPNFDEVFDSLDEEIGKMFFKE